jgi:hypothetical protein
MINGTWYNRPAASAGLQPVIELLNVRFAEEVCILPAPRSLAEAADMGQSRQVKRLRSTIEHWIAEVGSNNPRLESRMRKDIAAAARDLRHLRAFREYKESPLIFGVKAVAGQIPIVANVVTLAETVGWVYERWLDRRSCWVTIKPPLQ